MSAMNLYLISHTFRPAKGGQEELVDRLAGEMSHYYDTTVATTTKGNGARPWGRFRDQEYNVLRCPGFGPRGIDLLTKQFLSIPCLGRAIGRDSVKVLHLFEPFSLGAVVLALKCIDSFPLVLSLIGMNTYDPINVNYRRFRRYIRFVMEKADTVTASTNELARRASEQGFAGRIEIVPHCVDVDFFSPRSTDEKLSIRKKHGIGLDDPVVFSLQRMHPRKRVEVLVHAAKLVIEETPDAKFLIGGTGPDIPKIERLIRNLDLQQSVKLVGFLPNAELPAYYSTADVFAFHTLYEGFGIVAIEAMASGTPVVTTDVGGLVEIVKENHSGFVVPPNSPTRMAEAILALMENSDRLKAYSIQARTAAEEKYSIRIVAQEYRRLYSRLLNSR